MWDSRNLQKLRTLQPRVGGVVMVDLFNCMLVENCQDSAATIQDAVSRRSRNLEPIVSRNHLYYYIT